MEQQMKNRYHVFLRPWGVYYCEDLVTKKQATLKTRDKDEAFRLVAAKNENEEAPAFSLHLARVYWKAGDPAAAKRTWQHVMDEIPKFKTGDTQARWLRALQNKAFHPQALSFMSTSHPNRRAHPSTPVTQSTPITSSSLKKKKN